MELLTFIMERVEILLALIGICALIGLWEKETKDEIRSYEGEKDKDGNDVYEDS